MKANGKNVIVKENKEEKKSSIIVSVVEPPLVEASIISIGDEAHTLANAVKCWFQRHYGTKVDIEGESYLVVNIDNIIAVD